MEEKAKTRMTKELSLWRITILMLLMVITVPYSVPTTQAQPIAYETGVIDVYGFLIPIIEEHSPTEQINISNLINQLFAVGAPVYWTNSLHSIETSKFPTLSTSSIYECDPGSYLVSFTDNPTTNAEITSIMYRYSLLNNVDSYCMTTNVADIEVHRFVQPRIAYHDGYNVYNGLEHWLELGGFPMEQPLDWDNISTELTVENFDVFIWGGYAGHGPLSAYISQMNVDAIKAVRTFVREGGGYIGICYGGYEISSGSLFPLNWLKAYFPRYPSLFFPGFTTRLTPQALPCHAVLTVQITSENTPLTYGLPSSIENCQYASGPMFIGLRGNTETIGVIQDIEEIDRDLSSSLTDHPLLQRLFNMRINYAKGKPIWVTADFGSGTVVAFGDHPNFYTYPRLAYNAILYSTSEEPISQKFGTVVPLSTKIFSEIEPFKGYVDEPLTFQLSDRIGSLPVYSIWEFDKGTQTKEEVPSYTYHRTGNYTARVTAVNDKGVMFLGSVPIDIRDKPTIDCYCSSSKYTGGNDVKAIFKVSVYGGFPPYTYKWNFGDGSESLHTNQTVFHAYNKPGLFTYQVVLSDQLGTEIVDSGSIDLNYLSGTHNQQQLYTTIVIVVLWLLVAVIAIIYVKKRR